MFSFNLRAKRHCIGNLQLSPEKYAQIRAKLVSEMHAKLVAEKKLPTIFEITSASKPDYSVLRKAMQSFSKKEQPKTDKAVIERAFSDVSKVILGKSLGSIDKYAEWLVKYNYGRESCKSCASGKSLTLYEHADFFWIPRDRMMNREEADFAAERVHLQPQDAESLSMQNISQKLASVAFFCPELQVGNLKNNIDCPVNFTAANCYKCVLAIEAKQCACSYWPRDSEYLFGANEVRSSSFCMNCYHSETLKRCFEMDSCTACSDCYFCHNIENCHDCMFCFNVKNLKNAVGNVELPREQYLAVKKKVLEQINAEIAKTNGVSLSIYNLPDRIKSSSR